MTSKNLIDIQTIIPGICVELRYATKNNFLGKVIYDFDHCLLLKETAIKLKGVQDELAAMDLALKVWDGYRPTAAQWTFWNFLPDERYVADPRKGGRHTRGTAVDVTLIDKAGQELLMPSEFDDFSEKAHCDYMEASAEAIRNRNLLQTMMQKHGFMCHPEEWWHFDLIGWENYPPL